MATGILLHPHRTDRASAFFPHGPELNACGRALARARQAYAAQWQWQGLAQQVTCSALASRVRHGGFACRFCQRVGTEMRSQCVPVSRRQARG